MVRYVDHLVVRLVARLATLSLNRLVARMVDCLVARLHDRWDVCLYSAFNCLSLLLALCFVWVVRSVCLNDTITAIAK